MIITKTNKKLTLYRAQLKNLSRKKNKNNTAEMKTFALQVLRTDSNVNKRSRGRGTNGIIKIFKEEKEKKKPRT